MSTPTTQSPCSVAVDVRTADTSYAGERFGGISASDETVQGTQITAGGDIAMQAGRDITLQAATVASDEGGIGVSAGRDVKLTAAQEQHDLTIDEQRKKKGFLKTKTTTTHDEWHDSIAVTTTLSGETVTVAAGRDLTTQEAQIGGPEKNTSIADAVADAEAGTSGAHQAITGSTNWGKDRN